MLASSSFGIVRLAFEDHADFDRLAERSRSRRGGRAARRRAGQLGTSLDTYFGGGLDPPEDIVDWGGAEQATSGALESTRGIPYGSPRSYERLGVEIEAYACGYAMGTNPIPLLLPCHRVSLKQPARCVGRGHGTVADGSAARGRLAARFAQVADRTRTPRSVVPLGEQLQPHLATRRERRDPCARRRRETSPITATVAAWIESATSSR